MNSIERHTRNEIIFNLLETGMSQTAIGKLVNLGQRMIGHLHDKFRLKQPHTLQPTGRPAGLSKTQLSELPTFLEKGAPFYGFTGAYWTYKRVGYVINKEFGIQYEDKQVGRILAKINWTRQKPQKKDAKQSAEKVKEWIDKKLPALKKKP